MAAPKLPSNPGDIATEGNVSLPLKDVFVKNVGPQTAEQPRTDCMSEVYSMVKPIKTGAVRVSTTSQE